jgi:hypothetical protein
MARTVWVRAGAKESEQDQQQGPWRSLRILLPVGYVTALFLATLPRVMPRLAELRVQLAAQGRIAPVSFPSHYS